MTSLETYGGEAWFRLGDRDLGTHLFRTDRLNDGAPLSTVTDEIARRWELGLRLLPATDDRLRTMVTLADGPEVEFQRYFVELQHAVPVASLRFDGAEAARPAPGVIDALTAADVVVIAPSNPFVSIAPILAVRQIEAAVTRRRDDVVAVAPIVAGAALKGPADRLLTEFGHEASVVGIARIYAPVAGTLVIDEADAALAPAVEAEGMRCIVTRTVMKDPGVAASLARAVLGV
jgi:LPPG:FO 2-phospho-L-lactate transferase